MTDVRGRYEERLAAERTALAAIQARWNQLSNLRLVMAVVVAVAVVWAVRNGTLDAASVGVPPVLIFLSLVVMHRQEGHKRRAALARIALLEESLARIERRWDGMPERSATAPEGHPYADDVDVVGRVSLLRLIDRTETRAGAARLASWLLLGCPAQESALRQAAARRLVGEAEWRDELALAGRLAARDAADPTPLIRALKATPPVPPLVRWLAVASTVATVLLGLADLLGLVDAPLWAPFVVLNGALAFGRARGTDRLGAVARNRRALTQVRRVLPVAERAPTGADRLDHLRGRLAVADGSASKALAALDRRLNFVIPPATILWPLLQLGLAWDVHVAGAVQRWAARHAASVQAWVDAVAELEALASLAALAADEPAWGWPRLDAATSTLSGQGLGHPLIPDAVRVGNDVTVGPSGTLLLVTGSNMAGKSTMLRSVALNAVLARAGGPACATALALPPWDVWTSVRIRDSVETGVSLYMAELLRLRQIVDAAKARPVIYLLDEILQGTNTAERRIAARTVMATLAATGAIGAVSTHDLELLADTPLSARATVVHFRDQVIDTPTGPRMHFDYTMRPGLAPSTNALRLLALVGLDEPADPTPNSSPPDAASLPETPTPPGAAPPTADTSLPGPHPS